VNLGLPISLDQPAGQILAVVFFLIPGLNATWIIERLAGRTPIGSPERFFRAVGLSTLIYTLASPWLLRLAQRAAGHRPVWPFEPVIGFALLVFVAPVVLGLGWTQIRRNEWARSIARRLTPIDPSPTPWDYVFARDQALMIRLKLRGGELIGGYFGPDSTASFYPEQQDIYVEQVWQLGGDGTFLQPLVGSRGILVRRDDVEVAELLIAPRDEGAGNEKKA
jgi:hypothetical protein